MNLKHTQKGITLASLAFYLGLLAFAVFTGLKLFPVYMEAFAIESSVKSLETDKNQQYSGALSVQGALMKRLSFNNVESVTREDVSVVRKDNQYLVSVEYENRIPYMFNIDLVLFFNYSAEVPAR